eukprot:scaffold1522_cov340-Prasinococcus_capsulatus_cf.AAC.17
MTGSGRSSSTVLLSEDSTAVLRQTVGLSGAVLPRAPGQRCCVGEKTRDGCWALEAEVLTTATLALLLRRPRLVRPGPRIRRAFGDAIIFERRLENEN